MSYHFRQENGDAGDGACGQCGEPLPADEETGPCEQCSCACGQIDGENCPAVVRADNRVVIEWMPPHLRSSHEAAGNRGVYPHNGAERLTVTDLCAGRLLGDWTHVVEGQ